MINLKQMFTGGEEGEKNPLGDFKSMFAELTKGKVNTSAELDVTKARLIKELESAKLGAVARDNLRATPEQQTILANIMRKVEDDFIKFDLKRDLGIKDPKKLEEYRLLFREYFVSKMSNEMLLQIYQSHEWEKLNMHVNELSKYAKLDEIIATCKIEGNSSAWTVFAEKHPMLANMGSWLIGWYVGNKKEKDLTKFDKKLLGIGKILSGEEEKKQEDETAKKDKETTEAKPEVKLADLDVNQKAVIQPLTDAGFTIDLNTVEEDMKYLKNKQLDQDNIIKLTTTSAKTDGKFYKVGKSILTKLSEKPMKFRLTDIYAIEELSDDQINAVMETVKKVEGGPTKMREALNGIHKIESNDGKTEIARYMQVNPDAQSVDASPESQVQAG